MLKNNRNIFIYFFTADCCVAQRLPTIPAQCQAVIDVPADDPVYSKYKRTCITFNRAVTSANFSCPLIPATFVSITL